MAPEFNSASDFPQIKWVSSDALLIIFGDRIDKRVQAQVTALDAAITETEMAGVVETVPTYTSLLVRNDPQKIDREELEADIAVFISKQRLDNRISGRTWHVPVAYGGVYGPDLMCHAHRLSMEPATIAELHATADYTISMFGFLPGFAYLSGLPPELAAPRRDTPRDHVLGGGIAIGGAQTAIGSVDGPCGWHIIGRTPIRTFVPDRTPATFLAVGDNVRFAAVPHDAFDGLQQRANDGELVAELLP